MSTGFWVATTTNGRGTRWATPSTVTRRSSITSSSADCVLGEVRLISSPITTLAKIGPGRNSNSRVAWLKIDTPVMSDGSRSGVNWTRFHVPDTDSAIARARLVLPTPGTSSSRMWPSETRATRAYPIWSSLPCSRRATLASRRRNISPNHVTSAVDSSVGAKAAAVGPADGGGGVGSALMASSRRQARRSSARR